MNNSSKGLSLTVIGALLTGCAQEQQIEIVESTNNFGDEIVATIDEKPIYLSVFDSYSIGRLQKPAEELSDAERSTLTDELIGFYLMADAADNVGITQEQDVMIDLELQRLQLLSRQMANRYLDENPPTETEIQLTYEQNIEQLSGRQYKARHILLDTEDEALDVISELQAGEDFQQLAIDRSTGPSGPRGGDLGWFTASTMVPPFAAAVSNMQIGTFSETPVQTRFGWHIILLEDINEQQAPELDSIRADLINLVQQQKIEEYLLSLRDASIIVVSDSE
ncbi:MAG: hypothetical protein CMM56_05345 [Rhodospirillaceae bacterium]|nr:hypothetical protein [Rhodospirillaceae bacterium]|tara:strand:- start:11848 stop:12687 length:840 start_codon:yes stop_codon:yes gene_type:complete